MDKIHYDKDLVHKVVLERDLYNLKESFDEKARIKSKITSIIESGIRGGFFPFIGMAVECEDREFEVSKVVLSRNEYDNDLSGEIEITNVVTYIVKEIKKY